MTKRSLYILLPIIVAQTMSAAVITGWDFQKLKLKKDNAPVSDLGTVKGTASTLGMANSYMTPGKSSDGSDIVVGDSASDASDPGNNVWRIRGGKDGTEDANGWSSLALIGTQGVQFLASTAGFTGIQLRFDVELTAQAEANVQVEYTLDGTTWINIPATYSGTGATVKTNATSSKTAKGSYLQFTKAAWFKGIVVDFGKISGAANNPKFGVRIVNASTGEENVNTAGKAYNNKSGNWRFDNVEITGTPAQGR